MTPHPIECLREHHLLAVIRARTTADAIGAADAVLRGGIALVEITFTVPETPRAIAELSARPGAIPGAGTVLTPAQAREAIPWATRAVELIRTSGKAGTEPLGSFVKLLR